MLFVYLAAVLISSANAQTAVGAQSPCFGRSCSACVTMPNHMCIYASHTCFDSHDLPRTATNIIFSLSMCPNTEEARMVYAPSRYRDAQEEDIEEAVSGGCMCSATGSLCINGACQVPMDSTCSDKFETTAFNWGEFYGYESKQACAGYTRKEGRSCYVDGCAGGCSGDAIKNIMYKMSDGRCWKAWDNCKNCLQTAVGDYRAFMPTTCPKMECALPGQPRAETGASVAMHAAPTSDMPLAVTIFAAFGLGVTLYGAFKHFTKQ